MRHLTPVELQAYLEEAETAPLLLDVREPWEFHHAHIAGSQLLPMGRLPAQVEQLDPKQEIVVICHHGVRSQQVAFYLEHIGFERIINLAGGVDAWAREVDPAMPRY
ncbi:sulfurtransferase [Ectothiorhodospiraceae bacterium 2226]|nr:sulfurtransferase [Ectothiorhodospiraceae bacterium 2226]